MSPVAIRRAMPSDGPIVQDIVFATLRSYGIEPDPEGLDADVVAFGTSANTGALEFVADLDGVPVGSVVLTPRSDGSASLSKFFVDARYRGRGIGRALLARAVQEARQQGFRSLHLETRALYQEAVHLYEATGWVRGPDLPAGYGPDRSYSLVLA